MISRMVVIWTVLFMFLISGTSFAGEELSAKEQGNVWGFAEWKFGDPKRFFQGTSQFDGPRRDDSICKGLTCFEKTDSYYYWEFQTQMKVALFFKNKKLEAIRLIFENLDEDFGGRESAEEFVKEWIKHICQSSWYDVNLMEGVDDWSYNGRWVCHLTVVDENLDLFNLRWEASVLEVYYLSEKVTRNGGDS